MEEIMPEIPDTQNNVFVSPSRFLFQHARNKVIARHGEMVTPSKKSVRKEGAKDSPKKACAKE